MNNRHPLQKTHIDKMLEVSPQSNPLYYDLTEKSAVLDISNYGRLRLTGNDSLDLMNRLTTNQIDNLRINTGVFTVLTSNKGRIIDLLYIHREDNEKLLVITSPNNQVSVTEWIDFYTFTEDVRISDISDKTKFFSIVGPNCEIAAEKFFADSKDFTIFNSSIFGLPCTNLLANNDLPQELIQSMSTNFSDPDILDFIRIERFVPLMNIDFSENNNPLEAGLKKFISFSKGCYIGQEVIARLDSYSKVQRLLVGLEWCGDIEIEKGSILYLDGIEIGNVTSSAFNRSETGGIGLGFLKKPHAHKNSIVVGTNLQGISTKIKVTHIPDL